MAVYNYDVVVLGSGPAGEGAAMNAAKAGRKVAMVDSRRQVGGNCTHLGTIPSKALRHSVRQIMQFNTNPMFRAIGEPRWFSFPDVLKSAEKVISKQVASRTGYYARNRIDMFTGTASFVDERTVEVVTPSGAVERLVADQFVIVSGLSVDEARLASETLTWLETNGYGEKAKNAIVVINQDTAGTPLVRLDELKSMGARGRKSYTT